MFRSHVYSLHTHTHTHTHTHEVVREILVTKVVREILVTMSVLDAAQAMLPFQIIV